MLHETDENFNSDSESSFFYKIMNVVDSLKKIVISASEIKFNESLKSHSTFNIGGEARVFYAPTDLYALVAVLFCAIENGVPYFVLGGGSNVVFSDDGFAGIVISTQNLGGISLSQAASANGAARCAAPSEPNSAIAEKSSASRAASETDCLVRCGAGASMADFVSFCTENALSGAEEFAGLPGSVGGAVYMNARCFDKSISDILVSIEYIDAPAFACEKRLQTVNVPANGAELRSAPGKSISAVANALTPSEIVSASASPYVLPFFESEWGYKKSPFQNSRRIITAATFRLRRATSASEQNPAPANASAPSEQISLSKQIASCCAHFISEREKRGHFRYPSAGSVFKNNRAFGAPSGKLVDDADLRGTQIGGAQIAPWHGNFIINTGNATARDVRALVDLAIEKVRERTGFTLEPEIIFVGQIIS